MTAAAAARAAGAVTGRLVLPLPGAELPDCDHARCADRLAAELAALRATLTAGPPAGCLPPGGAADRVRHRWLTGHHAAFTVWQALTRGLYALAAAPEPAATRPVAWTTALYDVYSVLFLYAGSCTPEQYATLLRPELTAAHPAFSGAWARDHAPVPAALCAARGRHRPAVLGPLTAAVKDNRLVRTAVARRLVPGGTSLAREAGRSPGGLPTEAERALYDAHFRVERLPLCGPVHRAQLVRLLTLCLADIGAHGLGPLPDGCPERFGREAAARLVAVAACEGPPARSAPPPMTPNPLKGRTT